MYFLSVPEWPSSVDVLLNINEVHALIKRTERLFYWLSIIPSASIMARDTSLIHCAYIIYYILDFNEVIAHIY